MIFNGNQRGGSKNLALHLLSDDNEQVEVHELRGFIASDLVGALEEIRAVSHGTRAKQYLYSLSLNPPPQENVPTQDFEAAIERAEKTLGLDNQPRAIVFHIKNNRRHCHVVWSRIDEEAMKAVPMSYPMRKLMALSKELHIEHGWKMPDGLINKDRRDPRNFTLQEWQQAKRAGKNARQVKEDFQDCWASSDNQSSFAQALKARGYVLAKGDRRGYVALDHRCEVYAVPKWVGIKTKDVRKKLADPESLPSVDEARTQIAAEMGSHLQAVRDEQSHIINTRLSEIKTRRKQLSLRHRMEYNLLRQQQRDRWQAETRRRQKRFNSGLGGILERVTGKRSRIEKRNRLETLEAMRRDRHECDQLIFGQIEERRKLDARLERLTDYGQTRKSTLDSDIQQYRDIKDRKQELFELRQDREKQVQKQLTQEVGPNAD
ncbi:MAG: relaxase/mobilization nuclease domain-containing protein [Pseudomonadales bacterium]|nr:relaxase/mobilization nuclease domain-containing protein [Pseudomonadales bacterium]